MTQVAAPMVATHAVHTKANFLLEGHGVLEMYICARCGFIEWYCQDPESIPIGPEYMTEIIDHAPDEPYR
ncbi:MAG: hypothetical protein ACTHU0_11600 [Kofleriaceae bacterium]